MVKKQPKRRAWRKAKIDDVEEALEDDRLVAKLARQGVFGKTPSLGAGADATDEASLFTVDTAGSCVGLSGASRRELARAKLFPPKPANLGLSATEEAKVARAEGKLAARRAPAASRKPEVFDLWAAKPAATAAEEEAAASTVRRRPQPVPQKAPKTLHQKVSAAPAVLPAHEGQSMNPAGSAYEELACMAAARELERERELEALDRKMLPMTHELKDTTDAEALKELDDEAKVRLYRSLTCKDGVGEGGGEDGGEGGTRGSARYKQKSQAQRNREKKRKDLDERQAQALAQRKLAKSVGEVGTILREMRERDEWQKGRREYRATLRAKRRELEATTGVVPKQRRLGRTRHTQEVLIVPEAAEAATGLRATPLKGSAVQERLASIVGRGLLPPPPEATQSEVVRRKKVIGKLKRSRKYMSPLLRDNLLLR